MDRKQPAQPLSRSLPVDGKILLTQLCEPCHEETCFRGFQTRSDTNRAVQPPVRARGLKFHSRSTGIVLSMSSM